MRYILSWKRDVEILGIVFAARTFCHCEGSKRGFVGRINLRGKDSERRCRQFRQKAPLQKERWSYGAVGRERGSGFLIITAVFILLYFPFGFYPKNELESWGNISCPFLAYFCTLV